ncbi:T9SS type A sorting domain-containing protein [Flavobacterium sp. RHBU_24]|uniref:T9SS type A sorting domain-containing protein n=1 Tax=Flavobacterium sp. RHBU_24 TaxID=3391185 RepID=UPI0039850A09
MKKITRNLWALTFVSLLSFTANAQINTIKYKKAKTTVTQKLAPATTYLNVGSITQVPCSTNFVVTFTVSNPGVEDLTSATINYTIDGFPATHSWEGSLHAGESETITFTVPNTATGEHSVSATLAALNGSTQGVPTETYDETINIQLLTTPAPTVTILIQPDNFPDEISWTLHRVGVEEPVAHGENYNPDPEVVGIITQTINNINPGECYVFTIMDDFPDGICCHGNGEGFYQIINSNGVVIYTGEPYIESATVTFGVIEQPAAVTSYTLSNIKLFPNPAPGVLHLEIPSGISLPDSYTIFNSVGQVVNKGVISEYNQQINVANFAGGVYFIKVDSGNATKTIQFIKS